MASDFGKVLDRIKEDNATLLANQERLSRAYEKLDARLNAMKAGTRIEPFAPAKGSPVLGFRRFQDGWHVTTHLDGLGGMVSEIPVVEAVPDVQVALMAHLPELLGRIASAIAAQVKATQGAVADADKLLSLLA